MKTLALLTILLAFSITIFECNSSTNNGEMLTLPSPVVSVTVSQKSTTQISFLAKASWHNGCGRFAYFDSTRTGFTYSIKVFGTQPKNAVCTQAFIQFDAPVAIKIPVSGSYTFRFWRSDTTSLDTTLVL